jgi:hypothetical protein
MKPKIFIATPMYGGQCYGLYMSSVMSLTEKLTSLGIDWTFRFVYNDALITRARNFITHEFLALNYTHLFFIDSDICFDADDAIKMIEADQDFVCGAYPCKHIMWDRVKQYLDLGISVEELPQLVSDYVFSGNNINIGAPYLKEVQNAGTGFMLIKREVFDTVESSVESYTSTEYNRFPGEKIKVFFDTSVDKEFEQYLSEDYHFCKTWKSFGGKIYIAEWVKLKHIGTYSFG